MYTEENIQIKHGIHMQHIQLWLTYTKGNNSSWKDIFVKQIHNTFRYKSEVASWISDLISFFPLRNVLLICLSLNQQWSMATYQSMYRSVFQRNRSRRRTCNHQNPYPYIFRAYMALPCSLNRIFYNNQFNYNLFWIDLSTNQKKMGDQDSANAHLD